MPGNSMNGNTSSLGTIGTRNFSDQNAKAISTAISRGNYRNAIKNDAQMEKFRDAVYKMVSGWTIEDKIAIIDAYGDQGQLPPNAKNDDINNVCTETIIIHLDPSDLMTLYHDVQKDEVNLNNDVNKIRKHQKQQQNIYRQRLLDRRNLSIKNFDRAAAYTKYARNAREYDKKRSEFDAGFKVPNNIKQQYRTLRRELLDVLKTCFNMVEITGIAFRMGIEVPDGVNPKDLYDWIINKTLLYVDLITGHSPTMYSNAFMDSAPYDELLQYTSYSYVTGKPGMNSSEWAAKKKAAREAKAATKERARMQSHRRSIYHDREMAMITGGNAAYTLHGLARQINDNDKGILSNASYDQLIELAGRYGIDPTNKSNQNIGMLKAKIYTAMRSESKRVTQLQNRQNMYGSRNRYDRDTADALAAHTGYDINSILGMGGSGGEGPSGTPIIHLNRKGALVETSILSAVPVYLVGQSGAGSLKASGGTNALQLTNSRRWGSAISASQGDKDNLNQRESSLYQYVMNLPIDSNTFDDDPQMKLPTSMRAMCSFLINECNYNNFIVNTYISSQLDEAEKSSTPEDERGSLLRRAKISAIWLLAVYYHMRNLQALAESQGGRIRGMLHVNPFKRAGNLLLSIATLGIVRRTNTGKIKGSILGNAFKSARHNRWPRNQADLMQSDLEEYIRDKNCKSAAEAKNAIRNLIKAKKLNGLNLDTDYFDKIDSAYSSEPDNALNIYRAAIAGLNGSELAKRLLMLEAGFYTDGSKGTYIVLRQDCIDAVNSIVRLGGAAPALSRLSNKLTNLFSNRNGRSLGNLQEMPETSTDADAANNPGQRLPVPKVNWSPGMNDDDIIKSILEVVPVYMVNRQLASSQSENQNATPNGAASSETVTDYSSLTNFGSGGVNRIKNGEWNLKLAAQEYNRLHQNSIVFDKNGEPSSLILKTPGDDSVVNTAQAATGAKVRLNKKKSKMYSPTKGMIMWAINHGQQFATGGDTFIAGDSLTNKPNPEMVTVKGDGTYSVRPIKKGPENGNSPLAIQHATGVDVTTLSNKLKPYLSRISKQNFSASQQNIQPTFLTNRFVDNLPNNLDNISDNLSNLNETISTNLGAITSTLALPFAVAAPMGTGTIMSSVGMVGQLKSKIVAAKQKISSALKTSAKNTFNSLTANTGGTIARFASGGSSSISSANQYTSAIVGDAASNNIFANGARPELVQSTGNISVTPLNTQSRTTRQKISKLTQADRQKAMTTAISSHVIKYNYNLPDGVEDVSNVGEAIKVYDVKPGVTDQITVNGTTTTIADILMTIATQLTISNNTSTVNTQLLTAIAKKPTETAQSSISSSNPFTSDMSNILAGN